MNWDPRQFSVCLTLLSLVVLTSGVYFDGDVVLNSTVPRIYYKGKWGAICYDSSRAQFMARSICRSLGLKYSYYSYGYWTETTFLGAVACRGDEKSIMGCPYAYLSSIYCRRKLRVKCKPNYDEMYCSFDSNDCNVTTSGTYFVWKRSLPASQSNSPKPSTDHSSENRHGKYMFASASGFPGQKTRFITQPFSIAAESFRFYYQMSGKDMGSLKIYTKSSSTETLVKTISGNKYNGWKHACVPLLGKYRKLQIIIEATQGSGYMSDIAVDDLTLSKKSCSFWNASCDFDEDTCDYNIKYLYTSYGWRIGRISGLKPRTNYGNYLRYTGSYYSTLSSSLTSLPLYPPSETSMVSFYYYMASTNPGELQSRFIEDGKEMSWQLEASQIWQNSEGSGYQWQYACLNLPANKGGVMEFKAIKSLRSNAEMAIDDIVFSYGSCKIGITEHVCDFNNPNLCNYTIDCMNPNEYTWRRQFGGTSSSYTGPTTDHSKSSWGYYMYTESSYGNVNDTAELSFAVSDVKDKYLVFSYNMYGSTVGSLSVEFTDENSKEIDVWIKRGNQGRYWHKQCIYITRNISKVTFISTRGTLYTGDIAVDTISISSKGCGGPLDCDFQEQMCKYKASYYRFGWKIESENSYSSDSNSYLRIYSTSSRENYYFQLYSPKVNVTSGTSVSFKYKMTDDAKEFALFVRYFSLDSSRVTRSTKPKGSYKSKKFWSSKGNKLSEFTTACVDLPTSTDLSLMFQVTAKANSYYDNLVYLDDITVNNETCKLGISHHFCEFKEIHLCDYEVECPENSEYTWQRGTFQDVYQYRYNYIPVPDNYSWSTTEYFMYADYSKGRSGDTTELEFEDVQVTSGKSLYFTYYIAEGTAKLQLQSEDSDGNSRDEFVEHGAIEGRRWNHACVRVTNYSKNYTYKFISTHGIEFRGLTALLEVGFKNEFCDARSISCDFTNPMICQYQNFTNSNWERIQSDNISGSTDDVYMQATPRYSIHGLASPTENISNSCVRIRYKIINEGCNLTIYDALNKKSLFQVVSKGTTPWLIYQVYIEKTTPTKLIFLASYVKSFLKSTNNCSVILDYVKVTNSKCPDLPCPSETVKCGNEYCYSKSKICDRVNDCSDGSDEKACPGPSMSCNFTSNYICGYKMQGRVVHVPKHILPSRLSIHIPDTLSAMGGSGEIFSPAAHLDNSCVKFRYITRGAVVGALSILSYKMNSDKTITRNSEWNESFFNDIDGVYEGQIQTLKGYVYLKIKTNIESGSFSLDDVTILNGTCPKLTCPDDTIMCLDKSRCLQKSEKCNNFPNCKDGSDELQCPKFLSCNFEDKNMCGSKSFPQQCWQIEYGQRAKNPRYDHSENSAYGQFLKTNCSQESRLVLPKITMGSDFCLDFYYIFSGHGNLSVYSNNTLLMKLPKFDAEIWTNAYVTLSKGIYNISFVYSGGNITTLALDSVTTKGGKCPETDCEENWNSCNYNNTCYPYTEKCNGIHNCPNGEDERNCSSAKPKYKLVGGRNLWSGTLKALYGSEYLPVCSYSLPSSLLDTVCSEFNFNGSSYWKDKPKYITGDYVYCYYYSLSCYKRSCQKCYCSTTYVSCSNTSCPLDKVSCPSSRNTTNTTCIFKHSLCDGQPDCEDGSDEENCETCSADQWQCTNTKCIKESLRCDGNKDCDDGSDEHKCFKYSENKTMHMYYKGSYTPICENNLKSEDIADTLCSYVGRSNGTFNNSVPGNGIIFKRKFSDSDDQLIPGFEPDSIEACNITKLDCSEQQCGARMLGSVEASAMSNSGQFALKGEWPYSASVYQRYSYYGDNVYDYFQGVGVILDSKHVLTHHIYQYSDNEIFIKTGSIWKDEEDEYTVDKVFKSKQASGMTILRLMKEIKMSHTVQPICLPEHSMPKDETCYIVGFGVKRLEEKKVKRTLSSLCIKHFPYSGNNTFCVNDANVDDPPHCSFDSGSYVTCLNEHGKWTVYGINSKHSCYKSDLKPSLFVDVHSSMEWIEKIT